MKKVDKSEAVKLHQNEEGILGNSVGEPLISSCYVSSLIEATIDPLEAINVEGKITDVNLVTENYGYPSKYD